MSFKNSLVARLSVSKYESRHFGVRRVCNLRTEDSTLGVPQLDTGHDPGTDTVAFRLHNLSNIGVVDILECHSCCFSGVVQVDQYFKARPLCFGAGRAPVFG